MLVKSLKLTNFRNYKKAKFDFNGELTIITGGNGIGKTNILESIAFLSIAKSPVAVTERDLIMNGSDYGHVEVTLIDQKKEYFLTTDKDSSRVTKVYKVNGVNKKASDFINGFRTVLFEPGDIRLVSGSPSRRRDYLDKLLSKLDNGYREALSIYNKALKNRNKLLEKSFNLIEGLYPQEIEVWDNYLIKSGQKIQSDRALFFASAKKYLPTIVDKLFPDNTKLELIYYPKKITPESLMMNINKDIRRGTTSTGPHLDDYSFGFQSNELSCLTPLKNYGSRGQQRMSVLAVKLLELKLIEGLGERHVLLLDDIFSEFDDDYRRAIEEIIDKQQTIITTAHLNDVPDSLKNIAQIIKL